MAASPQISIPANDPLLTVADALETFHHWILHAAPEEGSRGPA